MDLTKWSQAALEADKGMQVPIGLMSFASDSRGQPKGEQKSLYLGAIVFLYAVWESYVEEVAVELAMEASSRISPDDVPPAIRDLISKNCSPWELSVSPGWRSLWVRRVETLTVGDGESSWGLNTASMKNVAAVFGALAISPVPERIVVPAKLNRGGRKMAVPQNISVRERDNTVDVRNTVDQLIQIRGEAVHTGRTISKLMKAEIFWWEEFVRCLYEETDRRARRSLANDLLKLGINFPV